jgi:membrane protein
MPRVAFPVPSRGLPIWVTAAAVLVVATILAARRAPPVVIAALPADAERDAPPPRRAWKDAFLAIYNNISEHRILAIAAGVTFYALLAVFPAIGTLVSMYGLFADTATINEHLARLSLILPAGAIDVIGDQVTRVAAQDSDTLSLTTATGLAIALWSANSGVKALFDALNVVHGQQETRGFIKLNLVSLAFTSGGIVFVALVLGLVVVLPAWLQWAWIPKETAVGIRLLAWPSLLIMVVLALALMYRFGPRHEQPKWRWITSGSCIATIGWFVASLFFSWYAANFAGFDRTYGSLGAAVGFMMWIWISAIVILAGAEVDVQLARAAEPRASALAVASQRV